MVLCSTFEKYPASDNIRGNCSIILKALPTAFTSHVSTEGKFSSVKLINTMKIYSMTLDHNWEQLNAMYYNSEYTYHLG